MTNTLGVFNVTLMRDDCVDASVKKGVNWYQVKKSLEQKLVLRALENGAYLVIRRVVR